MAGSTTNYALTKPGSDEPCDIGVLNENFDILDTALAAVASEGTVTEMTNAEVLTVFNKIWEE